MARRASSPESGGAWSSRRSEGRPRYVSDFAFTFRSSSESGLRFGWPRRAKQMRKPVTVSSTRT